MTIQPSTVISKNPHISWYRNFFTEEQCSYLLQVKEYTFARRKVDNYGNPVRDIHFTDSFGERLTFEQIKSLDIPEKFTQYFGLDSFTQIDSPTIVQYPENGYIVSHVDGGPVGPVNRRRSTFILYLNSGYNGGDLKFNNLNIVVKPKIGCGVYFEYPNMETNNLLTHESTPNTGCPKYCIPFFIRTPEYISDYREEWIKVYGEDIKNLPYF